MKTITKQLVLAIWMASLGSSLWADTAAEMLEKGIYNEETVGNLDAAIKIYRAVVTSANETERVAANAQYRLGQCLLKQKKNAEAMKAFQTVIDSFPKQTEFVEKAKKHLPAELTLLKAPWKAGERLTLEMKLPGGQSIGLLGTGVESGEMNGKPVWKMAIRRFVGGSQNEGVSMVAVDKATNFPIVTKWDHTLLGKADGKWSPDKLEISMAKNSMAESSKKSIDLKQPAYSNDQWFFGFRQLPVKIGYKATLPIHVAFTGGNKVDMEVEVNKKEKVSTPAGEYDCFRLDTNINQTFWIADVPERYVAKFEANGVEALLTNISTSNKPVKLQHKALGCSLNVPKGWFYFEPDPSNDLEATYVMVSPQMQYAVVSIKDINQLSEGDRKSVDTWAESKIDRGSRRHKKFALRDGSRKAVEIAGAKGTTFIADYEARGVPFTSDISLALTDSRSIALSLEKRKGTHEKVSSTLDALRDSISFE